MRSWTGLAVLALPCLLVSLDAEVLNLAAPQLSRDLHPSGVQLLWIMDSYVFVVAGALIAMGVLGDRIGRRRLLLAGAAAFGAASVLAAFATTPELLIAARVLMGLAGASLMPSTLALIRVMFPDARQRTIALGIWSASFSLGGVASPLIGGALLTHFWWGSVFLIAVPVVLLLLVLGPVLLPESRDGTATTFDTPGALLSLASVLLFVYGVKRVAASGAAPAPLLAMALAVALGVLFLRRQGRIPQPLLDLTLFRDSRVAVAVGSNALAYFVLYGSQLAITQYLQLILGLSPLRAGLWALPSVIAYLLASFAGPALTRYLAPGRVIAAGLATMAAGFAVLALGGLPAVVTGMIIYSIGLAPAYILATELVVATVRPARAGMAAAVTETGSELGGALGIALLGSLVVATYRHGTTAGGTLVDAVTTAANQPARVAEELLRQADAAYGSAFTVMSLVATGLVTVAAVLAATVLRPRAAAVLPDAGQAALPDAELGQAALPDARLPQAALPNARLPQAALPDARLPQAALPDAELAQAAPLQAGLGPDGLPQPGFPRACLPRAVLSSAGVSSADASLSSAGVRSAGASEARPLPEGRRAERRAHPVIDQTGVSGPDGWA